LTLLIVVSIGVYYYSTKIEEKKNRENMDYNNVTVSNMPSK
jgi:hypothetical protein